MIGRLLVKNMVKSHVLKKTGIFSIIPFLYEMFWILYMSLFLGSSLFSSRCVFHYQFNDSLTVEASAHLVMMTTTVIVVRLLLNDNVNTCASVLVRIDSDLVTVEESFRSALFPLVLLFSLSLSLCGTWTRHSWSDFFCFTLFLLPSSARRRSAVEAETDLKQTQKKPMRRRPLRAIIDSAEFSDGQRWNILRHQCRWVPKRSRCSLHRHTHRCSLALTIVARGDRLCPFTTNMVNNSVVAEIGSSHFNVCFTKVTQKLL